MKNDFEKVASSIAKDLDDIDPGAGDKWELPWVKATMDAMPINAVTDQTYKGGTNQLILWILAQINGWDTNYWAGFGQWGMVGAKVRKGEKSTYIMRPKMMKDDAGETIIGGFSSARVFNASQIDGWTPPELPDPPDLAVRIDRIEHFIEMTGASIEHNEGGRAFYHPAQHRISIPKAKFFKETDHGSATEHYYAVLFHELTHWTLHPDLCNRKLGTSRREYAFEELVAELGSAFLCFEFGIKGASRRDHAQYIKSWSTLLKDKPTAFINAGQLAARAVGFLTKRTEKAKAA
jgi:antirestriction protein ArdC